MSYTWDIRDFLTPNTQCSIESVVLNCSLTSSGSYGTIPLTYSAYMITVDLTNALGVETTATLDCSDDQSTTKTSTSFNLNIFNCLDLNSTAHSLYNQTYVIDGNIPTVSFNPLNTTGLYCDISSY